MRETQTKNLIQIALAKIGARLFRNNVGGCENKYGQWISYGLCPGSSDLIGWHSVIVTEEMVGKPVAVFLAVEVKAKDGRIEHQQENFITAVVQAGGVAFVARSTEEAIEKLRGHLG